MATPRRELDHSQPAGQGRTRESDEFVREIHTQMPVILPEVHHACWLSGEAGKEVLVLVPLTRRTELGVADYSPREFTEKQ